MTTIDTKPFGPAARVQAAPATVAAGAKTEQVVAIGYLRAFVTLLVLAHHAVLAYHPYAPPPAASLAVLPAWWQIFPVVDPQRWPGIDLFVIWNDAFFMSLMFLLSGLFVWRSLERKGPRQFLRDRVLRLGLPFAVGALLLGPLAYYPAYLATTTSPSLAGFWQQWMSVGNWASGPVWFLWLLLAFDAAAAGLFVIAPRWPSAFGRLLSGAARRPVVFFGAVLALSAIAYIPLTFAVYAGSWSNWGPFALQTSRLFHYFAYFLIGAAVGHFGFSQGLLARDSNLARRWWLWVVAAVVIFALFVVATIAALMARGDAPLWTLIGSITFVLDCAATSFACLAVFARFAQRSNRVFDSLRDNAFGIYLIHYAIVSWLQYSLLTAALPGAAKGSLVILGALALSWALSAALRRIPAVAQVV